MLCMIYTNFVTLYIEALIVDSSFIVKHTQPIELKAESAYGGGIQAIRTPIALSSLKKPCPRVKRSGSFCTVQPLQLLL